jgi:hypothetical protein
MGSNKRVVLTTIFRDLKFYGEVTEFYRTQSLKAFEAGAHAVDQMCLERLRDENECVVKALNNLRCAIVACLPANGVIGFSVESLENSQPKCFDKSQNSLINSRK